MINKEVSLKIIANDIGYIKQDVAEIKSAMKEDYITRMEFDPIKKIVYGMVTLILTAVIVALLALVIKK